MVHPSPYCFLTHNGLYDVIQYECLKIASLYFPSNCCISFIPDGGLRQCFSTFLLQRNLSQMFVLLMEPCAMIQVSVLLQPHRTVVAISS